MKKSQSASPIASLGTIRQTGTAASGINLGGIGTAGVELWPDGRFHQWKIANAMPWSVYDNTWHPESYAEPSIAVGDTDFFIRIESPALKRPVYRWLFTGNGNLCTTASHFYRHHKYFFIKSVAAIDYRAEYPFVYLTYVDDEIPVKVSLKAWSPSIPRDLKNSSLPGFLLDFTVENPTKHPVKVSLVWQQVNFAGYAAKEIKQRHTKSTHGRNTLIRMEGSTADPTHDSSGCKTVWAAPSKGQSVTSLASNPYMQNIMWSIHRTGGLDGELLPPRLQREEMVETPRKGAPNKAWLCVQQTIDPKSSADFHFGLAWHFPNHRSVKKTLVGHMYENWFKDSTEVAKYLIDRREKLHDASRLLPEMVMASTLPESLRLSLLDQLNTLTTNSQFLKSGRIGIQEGQGCCSYNTTDVDHYSSYAPSLVQPEFRQIVCDMHTAMAHPKNGKMYHGFPGTVEDIAIDESTLHGYNRWDVCCQYVIQVYRDAKWSGNKALLERAWEAMKRTMDLVASMDFYKVGLPYLEGGITYDHWRMKGVVGYMAGVYLAALRAMEDAAELLGDVETASTSRARFEYGLKSFEKLFWNGKQYVLYYGRSRPGEVVTYKHEGHEGHLDPQKPDFTGLDESCCCGQDSECCKKDDDSNGKVGEDRCLGADCCCEDEEDDDDSCCKPGSGCCDRAVAYEEIKDTGLMTDLLNGNATTVAIGLGSFLDPKRVKAQLKLTLLHNLQEENQCVVNGTYPDDHFLDEWPFMQWQTPWTGTEYFFAIQLYAAGMVEEGDKVIDIVLKRHLREGMRFDQAECNNHYARPLCIWGAYTTRLGLDYDGWRGHLTFKPVSTEPTYSGLLATGTALSWLDYSRGKSKSTASLTVREGGLSLKHFTLRTDSAPKKATVTLNDKKLDATVSSENGATTIQFAKVQKLKVGSVLDIVLG
ncbi:MAG: GH116 family glycosyl-hydrolase [Verrucomicrobiota bacterium]|nr:GH116 family glycosyl-hydrolase [Verrucomicrobiota bacterium]